MANDSLLADAIASMLAEEIDLDVVRVIRHELVGVDHSVVMVIDEGEPENESIPVAELFRNRANLLVIMISLKSRDMYLYESYQLVNPRMEQVIHIAKEFSKMNLKKDPKARLNSSQGMAGYLVSFLFHFLRRKRVINVTQRIPFGPFPGFDI
jgi:hypothetical protein